MILDLFIKVSNQVFIEYQSNQRHGFLDAFINQDPLN